MAAPDAPGHLGTDAPGHGGRAWAEHDEREIAELFRARAAGEPEGPIVVRYNARPAELVVPEWRSILDALQQLPEIGTDDPVGYFGLNRGTAIGVPLVATESRITAAVFGQHIPQEAFASAEKTLLPTRISTRNYRASRPTARPSASPAI